MRQSDWVDGPCEHCSKPRQKASSMSFSRLSLSETVRGEGRTPTVAGGAVAGVHPASAMAVASAESVGTRSAVELEGSEWCIRDT